MRVPALIFSLIGFYGLLMVTNVTVYHFMPSSSAQEGGLIEVGLGLIVGGIASLIAGCLRYYIFGGRKVPNYLGCC